MSDAALGAAFTVRIHPPIFLSTQSTPASKSDHRGPVETRRTSYLQEARGEARPQTPHAHYRSVPLCIISIRSPQDGQSRQIPAVEALRVKRNTGHRPVRGPRRGNRRPCPRSSAEGGHMTAASDLADFPLFQASGVLQTTRSEPRLETALDTLPIGRLGLSPGLSAEFEAAGLLSLGNLVAVDPGRLCAVVRLMGPARLDSLRKTIRWVVRRYRAEGTLPAVGKSRPCCGPSPRKSRQAVGPARPEDWAASSFWTDSADLVASPPRSGRGSRPKRPKDSHRLVPAPDSNLRDVLAWLLDESEEPLSTLDLHHALRLHEGMTYHTESRQQIWDCLDRNADTFERGSDGNWLLKGSRGDAGSEDGDDSFIPPSLAGKDGRG